MSTPHLEQKNDALATLQTVWSDYLIARGMTLKASTIADYKKRLPLVKDWMLTPIVEITKDEVQARHREITVKHGPAQANSCFRVLRALFSFARNKYEKEPGKPLLTINPVSRLGEVRAWNKLKNRRTMIHDHQMKAWFQAVLGLRNKVVRDYLIVLLLTGLRRAEAARLRWEDVNLETGYFVIKNPKNGEDHEVPLSDYLQQVFENRWELRKKDNPYVFPGRVPGQPLSNCFKSFDRAFATCGFRFKLHDLRRTFLTTAHELKFDVFTLRELANHKAIDDITALYVIFNHERLRPFIQHITDRILIKAELREPRHEDSIRRVA